MHDFIECDFQPTGEMIERFGRQVPRFRCARENCGKVCHTEAVRGSWCRVNGPPPEYEPCPFLGEVVGLIEKCGCGNCSCTVSRCAFLRPDGSQAHPFCTEHGLSIRAQWQKVPGVTSKPQSCGVCVDDPRRAPLLAMLQGGLPSPD